MNRCGENFAMRGKFLWNPHLWCFPTNFVYKHTSTVPAWNSFRKQHLIDFRTWHRLNFGTWETSCFRGAITSWPPALLVAIGFYRETDVTLLQISDHVETSLCLLLTGFIDFSLSSWISFSKENLIVTKVSLRKTNNYQNLNRSVGKKANFRRFYCDGCIKFGFHWTGDEPNAYSPAMRCLRSEFVHWSNGSK